MKMLIQSSKEQRRFLGLAALALILAFNAGCSTPTVPYTDPNPPTTAWEAYQTCIAKLPPGASESACDYVGTSSAQSASVYTNSNSYVNVNGQIQYYGQTNSQAGRAPSSLKKQAAIAYHTYLNQLDSRTLEQLTQKWTELASRASENQ